MKHMRFCIHAANNGTSLKKNGTASLLGNIQSVMKGLRRAFIKPNNAMGLQQTSFARRNIKIGRLLSGHGGPVSYTHLVRASCKRDGSSRLKGIAFPLPAGCMAGACAVSYTHLGAVDRAHHPVCAGKPDCGGAGAHFAVFAA